MRQIPHHTRRGRSRSSRAGRRRPGRRCPPAPPLPAQAAPAAKAQPATRVLQEYLTDTWKSFVAMTDEDTGLPADNVGGDLDPADRSGYTSPTNIGAYLWSTVVARDTGLISQGRGAQRGSRRRIDIDRPSSRSTRRRACSTTGTTRRPATKLTTWPVNGDPVYPFVSSVDNGWLATGLLVAARADGQVRRRRGRHPHADGLRLLLQRGRGRAAGAGGRSAARSAAASGSTRRRAARRCCSYPRPATAPVYYTCHHYGAFNTEPRMASLPRHRRRPDPGRSTTSGPCAPSRRICDYTLDRDHADRRVGQPRGRRRVRGHAALPRHEDRPDLGRQHVRGADGAAVRARGEVGPDARGA